MKLLFYLIGIVPAFWGAFLLFSFDDAYDIIEDPDNSGFMGCTYILITMYTFSGLVTFNWPLYLLFGMFSTILLGLSGRVGHIGERIIVAMIGLLLLLVPIVALLNAYHFRIDILSLFNN